ncbi:uncharacterized protein FIESC28_05568 [Fusarium coffeatum]|uniref:C2H2-type domain-containing protein n=1 Tax=Fusarium coffeatum TaxID=231269 RepID=A0A366RR43_9HYPO|nr:uncharacterized protein FIESC28_05568 [Fusarium coffeatum]RBR19573.1 hypothetical protein FIESC28_05568 [Fusarium coffeatum]
MTDHSNQIGEAGLHHLPFRTKESHHNVPRRLGKRVPESLNFTRLRSPTESSMSSISSANVPDSATTHSLSTLASPISTTYAASIQEQFAAAKLDAESRPASRICHRHNPSNGTCSTFVNEDDDAFVTGYPEFDIKIRGMNERAPVEIRPASPVNSLIKEERVLTPTESHHTDTDFDADDEDSEAVTPEDANLVLNYALQVIYGVDLNDTSIPQSKVHSLVSNFTKDISQHIWQSASDGQLSHTMSMSSSSSTPSQDADRRNKRKKAGKREDDGDEFSDGEGSGILPAKRPRPNPKDDENLRLSCPFRKRNPHRFNVRDHHSCAMTYFPKFAELRQHIVKQHKRDDPSAYVCDRCSRDFTTRKELRDHQRLPKEYMCDIADADAESGIDPQTATKLLSRKRASGTSPEVQWREIWNIVFPDDDDSDVRPYEYTPVIEHFEISARYKEAFETLKSDLMDKISNPATLETLSTKFYQCFVETLDTCIANAQNMPYTNRSNKKNEIIRSQPPQTLIQRKSREIMPRPDSGVILDDGSESSSLGHRDSLRSRDSLRTVGRGSRVPETVVEIVTPTTGFEPSMLGQMDVADVAAWNNGVMYQPMMGDQMPMGQPDYMSWGQMYPGFDTLGNGFTGFNGQQ